MGMRFVSVYREQITVALERRLSGRTLFEGFDLIDGKPSQAEKEVYTNLYNYMNMFMYVCVQPTPLSHN